MKQVIKAIFHVSPHTVKEISYTADALFSDNNHPKKSVVIAKNLGGLMEGRLSCGISNITDCGKDSAFCNSAH